MAFSIAPVTPNDTDVDGFPGFIAWLEGGAARGDDEVMIVDFVGPNVVATRGVGENSHVITVAMNPSPPAPAISVGWTDPIGRFFGSVAHSNSGVLNWSAYDAFPDGSAFARVVGYSGGTVVWTPVWVPLSGGPSPVVSADTSYDNSGVRVRVGNPFGPITAGAGQLTLTATVNGVPTDSIILTIGSTAFYPNLAWGPAP